MKGQCGRIEMATISEKVRRQQEAVQMLRGQFICVHFRGKRSGQELRLRSSTKRAGEVRRRLKTLGIVHTGTTYRKRGTWILPLYCRLDVLTFLDVVEPDNAAHLLDHVIRGIKRKSDAEKQYLDEPPI